MSETKIYDDWENIRNERKSLEEAEVKKELDGQELDGQFSCEDCFGCLYYPYGSINYSEGLSIKEKAAKNGHLKCLKMAERIEHIDGYSAQNGVCYIAASNGNLDCLIYAHEKGYTWNERTCNVAALNGHLNCLMYAHESGCPWSKKTCKMASEGGHLDCLRYLHESGCPWDKETCDWAIFKNRLDCLEYSYQNGCPHSDYYDDSYISRFEPIDPIVIGFIISEGFMISRILSIVFKKFNNDIEKRYEVVKEMFVPDIGHIITNYLRLYPWGYNIEDNVALEE
jgi:hypothetical protein